jgi:hypothetical protein
MLFMRLLTKSLEYAENVEQNGALWFKMGNRSITCISKYIYIDSNCKGDDSNILSHVNLDMAQISL